MCSMVNSAAIVRSCMFPSGAMVLHHGDSVKTVKMVSVVTVFLRMMPCLMHTVPEGRACCLCVWSTRELGVVYSCHTIVNHRVVWHIILTLRCSMRVFSAFSWLSLQCVVKHWPRGCIWNRLAFGSLRVGMCVLSLCSWVCLCHCWVMFVSLHF